MNARALLAALVLLAACDVGEPGPPEWNLSDLALANPTIVVNHEVREAADDRVCVLERTAPRGWLVPAGELVALRADRVASARTRFAWTVTHTPPEGAAPQPLPPLRLDAPTLRFYPQAPGRYDIGLTVTYEGADGPLTLDADAGVSLCTVANPGQRVAEQTRRGAQPRALVEAAEELFERHAPPLATLSMAVGGDEAPHLAALLADRRHVVATRWDVARHRWLLPRPLAALPSAEGLPDVLGLGSLATAVGPDGTLYVAYAIGREDGEADGVLPEGPLATLTDERYAGVPVCTRLARVVAVAPDGALRPLAGPDDAPDPRFLYRLPCAVADGPSLGLAVVGGRPHVAFGTLRPARRERLVTCDGDACDGLGIGGGERLTVLCDELEAQVEVFALEGEDWQAVDLGLAPALTSTADVEGAAYVVRELLGAPDGDDLVAVVDRVPFALETRPTPEQAGTSVDVTGHEGPVFPRRDALEPAPGSDPYSLLGPVVDGVVAAALADYRARAEAGGLHVGDADGPATGTLAPDGTRVDRTALVGWSGGAASSLARFYVALPDEYESGDGALADVACGIGTAAERRASDPLLPGRFLVPRGGTPLRADDVFGLAPELAERTHFEGSRHLLRATPLGAARLVWALPVEGGFEVRTTDLRGTVLASASRALPAEAVPSLLALDADDGLTNVHLVDRGLVDHAYDGSAWTSVPLHDRDRPVAAADVPGTLARLVSGRLYLAYLDAAHRVRFAQLRARELELPAERRIEGAASVTVRTAALDLVAGILRAFGLLDMARIAWVQALALPWQEAVLACWPRASASKHFPSPNTLVADLMDAGACQLLTVEGVSGATPEAIPQLQAELARETWPAHVCACVGAIGEHLRGRYPDYFRDAPVADRDDVGFLVSAGCADREDDPSRLESAAGYLASIATDRCEAPASATTDVVFHRGLEACFDFSACVGDYLLENGGASVGSAYELLLRHEGYEDYARSVSPYFDEQAAIDEADLGRFKKHAAHFFVWGSEVKLRSSGKVGAILDEDPAHPSITVGVRDASVTVKAKAEIPCWFDAGVKNIGMFAESFVFQIAQDTPSLFDADLRFADATDAARVEAVVGLRDLRVRAVLKNVRPTKWDVTYSGLLKRRIKKKVKRELWIRKEMPRFECLGYEFVVSPSFRGTLEAVVGEDGALAFRFPVDEVLPVAADPVDLRPAECTPEQNQAAKDELLYFTYLTHGFADADFLEKTYAEMASLVDEEMDVTETIGDVLTLRNEQEDFAVRVGRMNLMLQYEAVTTLWAREVELRGPAPGFLLPMYGYVPRDEVLATLRDVPIVTPGPELLTSAAVSEDVLAALAAELPAELYGDCWEPAFLTPETAAACRAAVAKHGLDGLAIERRTMEQSVEDLLAVLLYEIAVPQVLAQMEGRIEEHLDLLAADVSGKRSVAAFLSILGEDFHAHTSRFSGAASVSGQLASTADSHATLASVDTFLAFTGDNPGAYAVYDRSYRPGPLADGPAPVAEDAIADVAVQEAALNGLLFNLQEAGAYHTSGLVQAVVRSILEDYCGCAPRARLPWWDGECRLLSSLAPETPLCDWAEKDSPVYVAVYLTPPDDALEYVGDDGLPALPACPDEGGKGPHPSICLLADVPGDAVPESFHLVLDHLAVDAYGLGEEALARLAAHDVDLVALDGFLRATAAPDRAPAAGADPASAPLRDRVAGAIPLLDPSPLGTFARAPQVAYGPGPLATDDGAAAVAAALQALEDKGEAWLAETYGIPRDAELLDGAFRPYVSLRVAVDARVTTGSEVLEEGGDPRCPDDPELQVKSSMAVDWTHSTRRYYLVEGPRAKAHRVADMEAGGVFVDRIVDQLVAGAVGHVLYTPLPLFQLMSQGQPDTDGDGCYDPDSEFRMGGLPLSAFRPPDGYPLEGTFYGAVHEALGALVAVRGVEAKDRWFHVPVTLLDGGALPPNGEPGDGVGPLGLVLAATYRDPETGEELAPVPCSLEGQWEGSFTGTDTGMERFTITQGDGRMTAHAEGSDTDEGDWVMDVSGDVPGTYFAAGYVTDYLEQAGNPNYIGEIAANCYGDHVKGSWRSCGAAAFEDGTCRYWVWRGPFLAHRLR